MIAFLVALMLCLATAALLWAAHYGFGGLQLDHSIRPLEVATLAVNAFIAFFLQYYFASRSNDLRAEKNLLIDIARDVVGTLKSCRDALSLYQEDGKHRPDHKRSVLQLFRRLSNSLDEVETALSASQCKSLTKRCDPIRDAYLEYKIASTNGSFPTRRFTADEASLQERRFRALNGAVGDLVFRINRYR